LDGVLTTFRVDTTAKGALKSEPYPDTYFDFAVRDVAQ
jgi:hypothetical protein